MTEIETERGAGWRSVAQYLDPDIRQHFERMVGGEPEMEAWQYIQGPELVATNLQLIREIKKLNTSADGSKIKLL